VSGARRAILTTKRGGRVLTFLPIFLVVLLTHRWCSEERRALTRNLRSAAFAEGPKTLLCALRFQLAAGINPRKGTGHPAISPEWTGCQPPLPPPRSTPSRSSRRSATCYRAPLRLTGG